MAKLIIVYQVKKLSILYVKSKL